MRPSSVSSWVIVHSAKTLSRASASPNSRSSSCCSQTIFSCSVRISSSPVRSPTCARRGYSWPPKLRWLIRPSLVRSNSAPYVSSSQTRSGASLACSSAIRQLLRNLPPRMVSPKCTIQLSLSLTLPIDAAQPPSAITVWALPNSDLEMIAVRLPSSRASMAARRPAPPAPMTTTSYSWISMFSVIVGSPHKPQVGDPSGRYGHDVEIGDGERGECRPRQLLVLAVEPRDVAPQLVAHRVLGEVVQPPAHDASARVARQRVGPEQDHVDHEDHVAQAEAEAAVGLDERVDRVVGVDRRQDHGEVEEVAVPVLPQQRGAGLARVAPVRLGHRARGRREPERPVVGLPVVVAGESEAEREDQDQQSGRQLPERERLTEVRRARDALVGETRGVERRQVRRG